MDIFDFEDAGLRSGLQPSEEARVRQDFKETYLTSSFFFVETEDDFTLLQMLGFWFGVTNHMGVKELLVYDWHTILPDLFAPGERVAKNLAFFPTGYFQECDFWVQGAEYGAPKNVHECAAAYDRLTRHDQQRTTTALRSE